MKTNLQRVFKVSAVIKHAWVGYTWSRLNRHVSLVQRMSAVSRCSAIVLFNAANALYAVCALQKMPVMRTTTTTTTMLLQSVTLLLCESIHSKRAVYMRVQQYGNVDAYGGASVTESRTAVTRRPPCHAETAVPRSSDLCRCVQVRRV